MFEDQGPLLSDFMDMKHPLVRRADSMQWEHFKITGALFTVMPAAHWPVQDVVLQGYVETRAYPA